MNERDRMIQTDRVHNKPRRGAATAITALIVAVALALAVVWGLIAKLHIPQHAATASAKQIPTKVKTPMHAVAGATISPSPVDESLLMDPLHASNEWVLQHLHLPEPFQTKVTNAVGNDEEFDEAFGAYFKQVPDVRGFPGFIHNEGTVENYERGILRTGRNEELPFMLPLNWAQTDLGPNHLAELHSLRLVTNFMDEYKKSGNPKYFELVENIVLDWIDKNPFSKPAHPRAWHEGAVGKRLMVLLNLMEEYKTVELPRRIHWKTFITFVIQHTQFLSRPETYIANGNHGMRQDLALLTASLVLPGLKESSSWQGTALQRLKTQQIDTGFSTDGIWNEHSPGYHHYVMTMIEDVIRLIHQNHISQSTEFLERLNSNSQHYLAHVLTPAGKFPPVGDTNENTIDKPLIDTEAIRYSASGGLQGKPLNELDGFFPQGGEAIFRDSWGQDKEPGWYGRNAYYVHMHASNHTGFGHRHADELSFVMFGQGRWWITEAGKYAYEKNAMRDFVQEATAHNGYTFQGAGYPSLKQNDSDKDVHFEAAMVSTEQLAAVREKSTRFTAKGVEVTRTFVFLRDRKTLVLLDHLKSPKSGEWQGFFYVAPDLAPEVRNGAATAIASTDPALRLEVVTEPFKLKSMEVIRGQKEPLLGWTSPAYRKIVATPVIVSKREGSDIVTATVIRVSGEAMPAISALNSKAVAAGYEINWLEGNGHIQITVGAKQPLEVTANVSTVSE